MSIETVQGCDIFFSQKKRWSEGGKNRGGGYLGGVHRDTVQALTDQGRRKVRRRATLEKIPYSRG